MNIHTTPYSTEFFEAQTSSSASGTVHTASQATAIRVLPSSALLQGGRSVDIQHNGAVYRLQATRLGKLILTK